MGRCAVGVVWAIVVAVWSTEPERASACSVLYPEGQVPEDGDVGVPLNVRFIGFAPGYELYLPGGGTVALVEDPAFGSRPADPLLPDTTYEIRACPGCGATTFTTGSATDDAAPTEPTLLSVEAALTPESACTNSRMTVRVTPATDDVVPPDRVGYNIYAGPEGGPQTIRFTYWLAEPLATGESEIFAYVPDGLGGAPFEVHVTAVDAAGNESAPSAPLRVVATTHRTEGGCAAASTGGGTPACACVIAGLAVPLVRRRRRAASPVRCPRRSPPHTACGA